MNRLVEAMQKEENFTHTENGELALKSTTSHLVDLFGVIGALRDRPHQEIISMFSKAFAENSNLAMKMSFYARDIRCGGLGEREVPKTIWRYLAYNYPESMRKNLKFIPFFGRWDDLWEFIDTPIENDMWNIVKNQIKEDINNMKHNKPISLLAKWMKSTNTSSKESKKIGYKTAQALFCNPNQKLDNFVLAKYRRMLSSMRKYIDVTERKMSRGNWNEISYPNVPSNAMNNYRNAFKRHDNERFKAYIDSVKKGESKINSSVLYPYNIVEKYMYEVNYGYCKTKDDVLEEQWKALPNYVDSDDNILIMADVSGSMNGRPMATSIGLAIYFAERNHGAFGGQFMTFSKKPQLQKVIGNSLLEKINNLANADWNMNTDIEAAFKKVLDTALQYNVPASDIPKSIIIISD